MLKFCSQPVLLANSGFSKPAKSSSLSHQLPLTELTMGCVYSYPLFSFQGSICFFSSEDYFIKSSFSCQVLFFIPDSILFAVFRQRMIFYQVSFSLSSTFLFIFLCLFSLFMSADTSISSVVPLVNVFLFKHSLLTNAYTLFPTAFVQRHLLIIHA